MKNICCAMISLLLCIGAALDAFSQSASPYNSGGNQYGGEYLSTPPSGSGSSFNNNTESLGANTKTPYGSSVLSNASSSQASASYDTEATTSPGPIEKMGQWVKRKAHRPTGQPELDLANQRIEAGKSRIKAVKARQKLEKHIVDSNAETEKLKRELQRAEDEASLLENQVKFNESNVDTANQAGY